MDAAQTHSSGGHGGGGGSGGGGGNGGGATEMESAAKSSRLGPLQTLDAYEPKDDGSHLWLGLTWEGMWQLLITLGFMTKTHPHNFEGHDSMNDPWADNYQYSEELALKGRDAAR